jgi:hypothetical protein
VVNTAALFWVTEKAVTQSLGVGTVYWPPFFS